jgi:hypothetical protein
MAQYPNTVPPELQTAINNASKTYGVPVDILVGVWRKESGSSFPNNFVNSSGYGGLFGTTHWNTSTQDQANFAAQTLAYWYKIYGNWASALYKYSGGAYTTVPGQTTNGGTNKVSAGGGPAPTGQNPPLPNLDVGGAIKSVGDQIAAIPSLLAKDTQHFAIGAGIGLLGVILVISGVLILAFTFKGRAEQSVQQGATA